jgi:putative ABC transport system substrate-binding protein
MNFKYPSKSIFITVLLITISLLMVSCGPQETNTVTVGVINLAPVLEPVFDSFKNQMTELGYIEGENITYIYDGPAGSIADLDSNAQDLIDADVDLILSLSTPATLAMMNATDEIPIVFAPINDPIASGLVENLKQPGGNATGIMFGAQEEKRFDWFLQIAPDVKRLYIPYNANDASAVATLDKVTSMAPSFGVEIVEVPVEESDQITAAIENIPEDVDAVYMFPDSLVMSRVAEFAAKALELDLPTSVPDDQAVPSGILMSYGMRFDGAGKQAARLADQILNGGVNPGDLPIESAEFFLVINLKTAQDIGLEISDEILRQADNIIR